MANQAENDGYIDKNFRHSLGYGLSVLSLSATCCLLFLKRTPWVADTHQSLHQPLQNTVK